MALLQISEPACPRSRTKHRLAVGIDLGTTNSLVATVRSGLRGAGRYDRAFRCCPRWCVFTPTATSMWATPRRLRRTAIPTTHRVVKRFMGAASPTSTTSQPAVPLHRSPGMVQLKTAAGVKSPVEVSAEILKVLRQRAEAAIGRRTGRCGDHGPRISTTRSARPRMPRNLPGSTCCAC